MQQYQLTFIDLALRRATRCASVASRSSPGARAPTSSTPGCSATASRSRRARPLLCRGHRAGAASRFDMLFGPAYKGIPLATATADRAGRRARPQRAVRLQPQGGQGARRGRRIVGAPLEGRVLIVDDVITAGTAVRESLEPHPRRRRAAGRCGAGARPAGARPGRAERGAGARAAGGPALCEHHHTCRPHRGAVARPPTDGRAFLTTSSQLCALISSVTAFVELASRCVGGGI